MKPFLAFLLLSLFSFLAFANCPLEVQKIVNIANSKTPHVIAQINRVFMSKPHVHLKEYEGRAMLSDLKRLGKTQVGIGAIYDIDQSTVSRHKTRDERGENYKKRQKRTWMRNLDKDKRNLFILAQRRYMRKTQEEVAKYFGVSQATVALVEKNYPFDFKLLEKVLDDYQVAKDKRRREIAFSALLASYERYLSGNTLGFSELGRKYDISNATVAKYYKKLAPLMPALDRYIQSRID